jgi:hypothetical protein
MAPRFRVTRALMASLSVLLLAACATLPPAPGCSQFGRGQFCLLPPSALPAVEASHLVTIVHDGQRDTFVGLLHVDAQHLRLAGFSLFGTSLFDLDYDGQHLVLQPASQTWNAGRLLALLELTLADPTRLQPALKNLRLTAQATSAGQLRELWQRGQVIARIEISGAPLAVARVQITIPSANLTVLLTPMTHPGAP